VSGPERLLAPALGDVRHGFFTRRGGVSAGPYASLNCSLASGDEPGLIARNRSLVAEAVGVEADRLVGATQVHGVVAVTVEQPWPAGAGPRADALVTRVTGLALGVITADCAPVLFADRAAGVCAAAHAGWRGALAGVLEATASAMRALGADPGGIVAAVGPCIGPDSYEVGDDMRASVLAADGDAGRFFAPGARAGHHLFDLPGYCRERLRRAGIGTVDLLDADTLPDEARFFSHRRRTLAGGGPIGHQISAIRL
jgi:YfiH family protein